MRLSDWLQKSQRSNNGYKLFLKKTLWQAVIQENLLVFFMTNRLRCHLVNIIMKTKFFRIKLSPWEGVESILKS